MKKVLVLGAMMLTALVVMAKAAIEREQSLACLSYAECEQARPKVKDINVVVTTQPQMHCENCEKKIKGNLRFEKGVKEIQCDIKRQRVTITYDADKTNTEAIIKSFGKFGYQATEIKTEKPAKKKDGGKKNK